MHDTAVAPFDAVTLTVDIVAAYVANNSLRASDIPSLLTNVHTTVTGLANSGAAASQDAEPDVVKATPAQIRKSITPDALISFIDGKPYKTLKRHLSTRGLDVAGYRALYGLPVDYPTVAPNYSAARSALAKDLGLGQMRKKDGTPAAKVSQQRKRGRPAKKAA